MVLMLCAEAALRVSAKESKQELGCSRVSHHVIKGHGGEAVRAGRNSEDISTCNTLYNIIEQLAPYTTSQNASRCAQSRGQEPGT